MNMHTTSDAIKLVFAGPMGAGKTTAIRSIADSDPISTEMPMSEGPVGDKSTTTVAFDYATVWLDDGTPLSLYGTPGQDYFDHMRTILLEGAIGVVLVLDGSDPDVARHCAAWLDSLRDHRALHHLVIGITKTDTVPEFSLRTVRDALPADASAVPVFTFDPRDRVQTEHLVRALLVSID